MTSDMAFLPLQQVAEVGGGGGDFKWSNMNHRRMRGVNLVVPMDRANILPKFDLVKWKNSLFFFVHYVHSPINFAYVPAHPVVPIIVGFKILILGQLDEAVEALSFCMLIIVLELGEASHMLFHGAQLYQGSKEASWKRVVRGSIYRPLLVSTTQVS
jgi:hypothetical protein